MNPRFATALVHYPCVNKHGEVFATSITNLDVHDIARSSRTYSVDAFYVVTPITAQKEMALRIADYWEHEGVKRNPDRKDALQVVRVVSSVEDAIAAERAILGADPCVVVTSAKAQNATTCSAFRSTLKTLPGALLLFGTGHGMAPHVMNMANVTLEPLTGAADDGYNHLSVRSAAAIFLDRLLRPDS